MRFVLRTLSLANGVKRSQKVWTELVDKTFGAVAKAGWVLWDPVCDHICPTFVDMFQRHESIEHGCIRTELLCNNYGA